MGFKSWIFKTTSLNDIKNFNMFENALSPTIKCNIMFIIYNNDYVKFLIVAKK